MAFSLREINTTTNPTLARPYGKQSTKGLMCYFERDGERVKFILLLCQGGKYGCDGIDKLMYNGFEVDPGDYVFHPGTLSTGYDDTDQGRPTFFPNLNFTFSGICYVEVFLQVAQSPTDANATPDGSEVFMRCLKVMQYEMSSGQIQETTAAFSYNPILELMDMLREVGQISFERFQVNPQSWLDGIDRCGATISWDKGTDHGGTVSIARFEGHIAFAQSIDPFSAANQILALCPGMKLQDVNGGLTLLPTLDRDAVHTLTFDPSQTAVSTNIVRRGLSFVPRDPSVLYNFYIIGYRDLDDPLYAQKYVYVDYKELRDSIGGALVQAPTIQLGVMRQSQAERIGWYVARSLTGWYDDDNILRFPAQIEVTGQNDSYKVAKCDNVFVSHRTMGTTVGAPMFCAVLKETFEPNAGERKFTVQLTARDLYRDTDHTQVQGTGATFAITTSSPLPAATSGETYSVFLQGSGGTIPYTWSITVGALPTGLSLNADTGEISGTPSVDGSFSFTVTLTDALSATASKAF